MKIRQKLLLTNIGGVVGTALILIGAGYWQSHIFCDSATREADKLIDADLNHTVQGAYNMISAQGESTQLEVGHDLSVTRDLVQKAGLVSEGRQKASWDAVNQFTKQSVKTQLPQFLLGGKWLGQNSDIAKPTPVVDEAKRLTECKSTIFQRMDANGDMLRVATNITTKKGVRAIGTYIPAILPSGKASPIISTVLAGNTFVGPAFIVDAWYISRYEPIKNERGDVIGMLFAAVPQNGIGALNKAVEAVKIGKTGSLSIIGGPKNDSGHVVAAKQEVGTDISEATDQNGKKYVREILNTAVGLAPEEVVSKRYLTKEQGEDAPTWKVYRISYYAPWSWVIVASAPENDFAAFTSTLQTGRNNMIAAFLLVGLIAIIICAFVAASLAKHVVNPLVDVSAALGRLKDKDFQSLSSAIEALEEGNLTSKPCVSTTSLSVSGNDEVGVMAKNFNKMLESLNGMIASYNTTRDSLSNVLAETMLGSDTIATSSSEVASGNQELASRTSQQAASLEETAASVEEITSLIDHSAENAKSAARLAEETKELAKSGGSVVKSTVASMREIEISSKKIAEIITVIDEIAFQTNLLALNAAVEAARVGEQGKGFAVVASEVRSLAGRSSIAAKEIKALVKDSVAKVSQGTSLVNKSGDELTQIVVAAEKVAKMVLEISNSTQEQSIGISQINKAILKIDNITQQNAALVEETSAASEGMADQARNLQRLVSRFHIDPSYRKNASSSDNTIHIDHSPKIKQVVNSTRKAVKTSEAPKLRISHSETTEEF